MSKPVPRGTLLAVMGLASLALTLAGPAGAATPAEPPPAAGAALWEARYDGPANGWDDPAATAVSPDGALVFVAGTSTGDGTGRDYATAAYDAATGDERWVARYDGPAEHVPIQFGTGWDEAHALAVSPDGTAVFVTGSSSGEGTGRDYATVAYDAATGNERWVARYDGPASSLDSARAIEVSPDGSTVFVTGESLGDDKGREQAGRPSRDYATVAYDAATGDERWVARYDGLGWLSLWNGWDTPLALDVSPDGSRVFVTGYSFSPTTNKNDYATVAYDAATGDELWAARYDGPGDVWDEAFALGVSPDGSKVFVTGSSGDNFARDYVTLAYSAATGNQLWEARYQGPTGVWNVAYALAVSPDGARVFVTGGSAGAGTKRDYATVAYSAATGEELWEARYDGPASEEDLAEAVSVTPDGATVVVTGFSGRDGGGNDVATLAYDAGTGEELWEARHSPGRAQAVAVGPDGSTAFVVGRVPVPGSRPPPTGPPTEWATVAYALGAPTLRYDGPAAAVRGETVTLSARLGDLARLYRGDDPPPDGLSVADRVLQFTAGGSTAEAVTDEDGVASVEMPVAQPYGVHELRVRFAGDDDDQLDPAETTTVFEVVWEHRFVDGDRGLWLNTITNELQFSAPGDGSGVRSDPGMQVETLATGDTVISVDYIADDLTVVGRFFVERETFAAAVRTAGNAYLLSG